MLGDEERDLREQIARARTLLAPPEPTAMEGLSALPEADALMSERITPEIIQGITSLVPEEWLGTTPRSAYSDHLSRRLASPRAFFEEAIRAHAMLV